MADSGNGSSNGNKPDDAVKRSLAKGNLSKNNNKSNGSTEKK
jgi:hypothetical protein